MISFRISEKLWDPAIRQRVNIGAQRCGMRSRGNNGLNHTGIFSEFSNRLLVLKEFEQIRNILAPSRYFETAKADNKESVGNSQECPVRGSASGASRRFLVSSGDIPRRMIQSSIFSP